MQVQNNTYTLGTKCNANFKSIKRIDYSGLYRKHPEYCKELIDAFKSNPIAMDFCKKYDVNIIFNAEKSMNNVESAIRILYDNPAISKFQKFLRFFNPSEDVVKISAWGGWDNLKESTRNLIDMILPESAGTNKGSNGLLNSHIEFAEKEIQGILDKKNAKKAEALKRKQDKLAQQEIIKNASMDLDKSIQDLINSTKTK